MSYSGDRRGRIDSSRLGFTLLELIVALALISVLFALVAPVAIQQYHRWEALRVARDLSHLRVALETFNGNVLDHPKYLTQLAYPITTADETVLDWIEPSTYTSSEVGRWMGPYIDNAIAQDLVTDDAFESGLGIFIGNEIFCVTLTLADGCERGDWVAVFMFDVRIGDFERVNDFIDPEEADLPMDDKIARGRLLFDPVGGIAESTEPGDIYYLATPYLAD